MSSPGRNKDHHQRTDSDPPPDYAKVVFESRTRATSKSNPMQVLSRVESLPGHPTKGEVGSKGNNSQSDQGEEEKLADFGVLPVVLVCCHCGQEVETQTSKRPTACAWISCVLIAVFLSWVCCFVPFCVGACNDVKHSCPHCGEYLGKHTAEC